jgi:hypothetical protein
MSILDFGFVRVAGHCSGGGIMKRFGLLVVAIAAAASVLASTVPVLG